ncbi:transcription factor SPN1, partial [Lecanoromycetidae sp. Uapishka_2]
MSSPSLSDRSLPASPLSPMPEDSHALDTFNKDQGNIPDPASAPAHKASADMDDLSDNDSILSDVDEAQFEDFDPNQMTIEERPIAVDEDTVKMLGRHKRKRNTEVDGEVPKKKKKEGKREKTKKPRKKKDSDDDDFSGGLELEGKRVRKKKAFTEGGEKVRKEKPTKVRNATPENEEELDPEERRRRALDRAMDAALKNPTKKRRKAGEIDLSTMIDEEISSLRIRMAEAAENDVRARQSNPPKPAMHKLKLLPEVTALLNRNSRDVENAIVDPETNLLESVRFFLEPLSDGSLPAYNIQRELFAALAKLPIEKDSLFASGIGKVVLFYTKTKKAEIGIKRSAERLLGEWSRPILKRSDDYRKRALPSAEYDPLSRPKASQGMSAADAAAVARERALAPQKLANRARVEVDRKTYSIVPRSGQVAGGMFARPLGASGEDAFRRMKARQAAAAGKGPRRG